MAGGAPVMAVEEAAFMDLKTFVTFEADFPDDASFTAGGDIEVPGGRALAEVLRALLVARGFTVSAPEQHEYYGWALTAEEGGSRTWLLLQGPGPWLVLAQDRSGIPSRVMGRGGPFRRRVLEALAEALRADGRFRESTWFTRAEYEAAGQQVGGQRGGGGRVHGETPFSK